MKPPVDPTLAQRKDTDTPAAGLSWREFFVRLGDGTLHDDAAARTCRDELDQDRPSRKRPAVRCHDDKNAANRPALAGPGSAAVQLGRM